MLPHGYEGQGPEHSSARLERFLQLCAEHNMQVCQPTTPAQIFHLLRRQMIRMFRKPLVIMTPKSLLRNKEAVSPIEQLATGEFQTVIGETSLDPEKVRRVVVCTGKVYYDLLGARREREADDIALVRLEQLYPFPHKAFETEIRRYERATQVVWCQDEPQNQGAWFFVQHHITDLLKEGQKLGYAGRASSASPAVGYYDKHYAQQKELLQAALGEPKPVKTKARKP
jgi:2-oxoglutarate dehydrogenase E1 component